MKDPARPILPLSNVLQATLRPEWSVECRRSSERSSAGAFSTTESSAMEQHFGGKCFLLHLAASSLQERIRLVLELLSGRKQISHGSGISI
jgi:hypothetical protein